jgi:hypothetical protein
MLAATAFTGCQDRIIEPIGNGSSGEAVIVPISKDWDTVQSFVSPDAVMLKNLIGKARWAMQDETSKQAKMDVRRMLLNSFKSRCPKSVYNRSIFAINKQLEFGTECTGSLDDVSVSFYTAAVTAEYKIVTLRGCLSVTPKAFAFFEMNLVAGKDDLVKYINERPPKNPQCKRVFDADRWQPVSKKDWKTIVVKVDAKSGVFNKKLSSILRSLFEKGGILHQNILIEN